MSKRIIVKIGGSTLGQHDTTLEDLVWLQQEGIETVVVHGGGKVITEWLDLQGVTSQFVNGLRITDEACLEVVVAVLAGLINKKLVAGVNGCGGQAVGLTGADAAIMRARIKDPALGLVGDPAHVDTTVIETFIRDGYLPIIAPIGLLEGADGPTHTLVNINADTFAAETGGALKAGQLIFLTDVPGVRDDGGAVLKKASVEEISELIEQGIVSGGMVPKVDACVRALQYVPSAMIIDGRRSHALRDCVNGAIAGTEIG